MSLVMSDDSFSESLISNQRDLSTLLLPSFNTVQSSSKKVFVPPKITCRTPPAPSRFSDGRTHTRGRSPSSPVARRLPLHTRWAASSEASAAPSPPPERDQEAASVCPGAGRAAPVPPHPPDRGLTEPPPGSPGGRAGGLSAGKRERPGERLSGRTRQTAGNRQQFRVRRAQARTNRPAPGRGTGTGAADRPNDRSQLLHVCG